MAQTSYMDKREVPPNLTPTNPNPFEILRKAKTLVSFEFFSNFSKKIQNFLLEFQFMKNANSQLHLDLCPCMINKIKYYALSNERQKVKN